jgi:hypothetical protein
MTPETPAQTIARLRKQVANLSAGRQVMCGFCGEVYESLGRTEELAASVKKHVAKCPDHPISQLLAVLKVGRRLVESAFANVSAIHGGPTRAAAQAWVQDAEAAIAKTEFVQPKKAARKSK